MQDLTREIKGVSLSVEECLDLQKALERSLWYEAKDNDFNVMYRIVSLHRRLDYFINHDEKGNLV